MGKEKRSHNPNIKGKRFGRLQAIEMFEVRKDWKKHWLCVCDCGELSLARFYNLIYGTTTSCGCFQKELRDRGTVVHGMTGTRFNNIYRGMQSRCNIKYSSQPANQHYSVKGIKCKWNTFIDFKKDMYESYLAHVAEHGEKNTTIDRINGDGDYIKENCRWATHFVQARNRSNNFRYKGEMSLDAVKRLGGTTKLIYQRLSYGWTMEDAFNKPIRKYEKKR